MDPAKRGPDPTLSNNIDVSSKKVRVKGNEQRSGHLKAISDLQDRAAVSTIWANMHGDDWTLADLKEWRDEQAHDDANGGSITVKQAMKQKQREMRRLLQQSTAKLNPQFPRR